MSKKKSGGQPPTPAVIENAAAPAVQNGLGEAIGAPNVFGLPGSGVGGPVEAVSSARSMFKNMRWYLVSNFRQLLSEIYVELGLVQTIVDVPVDDALRGGIEIKSQQLDEDQIEELQIALDRDRILIEVGQAAKWNRLFGGAALLILTDQDPSTPLEVEAIGTDTPLRLRAVDMWEISGIDANLDDEKNMVVLDESAEFYEYYGEKIHHSRVLLMKGMTAPSFIRARLRGFGLSVVERLVRSINQYLKATDLGFEVLDEFKLDVYKIKNLVNTLLSPGGQQKVTERVRLANWQKNYQNAVVMDAEDDFDHKQLSFAGLAEAMAGIRMQVASDMRMPLTKLFGISASGFNSGEDDIEVYNAMVESEVRSKIKYDILRACEIMCQKLFGMIPDDLTVAFKPLRVLSAEQEETVKTSKFNRLLAMKERGEITTKEFRDAINKGGLVDILLDTEAEGLDLEDPELDDVAGDEGEKGKDDAPDAKEPKEAPKGKDPKEPKAKDPKKAENCLTAYSFIERMERILTNSLAYDVAAYQADGGDDWVLEGRREFFEDPANIDRELWAKAIQASETAFGEKRWQFVAWWYKKQGGKFS